MAVSMSSAHRNESHLPTDVRFCCWVYPLQGNDFTCTVG